MSNPTRNYTLDFADFLAETFSNAGVLKPPFEEIEGGRDDYRLSTFLEFTKDWSRERLELFRTSYEDELVPPLVISDHRQLVRAMFSQDLTLGQALILCLGLDPRTRFETLPGKFQLEIIVALDTLVTIGPWETSTGPTERFDTKVRPGEFTCLDEVLSLLSSTDFPIDESVRTCWKSIRGLKMSGRATEPFIADEVIERLFFVEDTDLCSPTAAQVRELEATIRALRAKIASLEDNEPKARTSLEKIVLGAALLKGRYDPRQARQEAVTRVHRWIEQVGLKIDAKTVRERLRDAYDAHQDEINEYLKSKDKGE